ncbi:MAG: glycosyltransferase family 1 protein [Desulfovibrionaceae bacterium]|nr:glycosyltransferase family 1 protein [Desulfovibrionaceae bacterium]
MLKLFWIGNPFFYQALTDYTIKFHYFNAMRVFTWQDIAEIAGFTPDILVVADKSLPPFVLGVEDFPCLTVFYAVDSHLQSYYPYYAQAFDACLLSLKDHIPLFVGPFLQKERILWSPPFAKDEHRPKPNITSEIKWDCIFVGRVTENMPKRKQFLDELANRLPNFYVTFGQYEKLFPQAKVVLNFCEHGDLNFRVFEALGMGSALVTPSIKNGQDSLFTCGEHFLLYDNTSIDSCLAAIKTLLQDAVLRQKISQQGLALVDAKHRASNRAKSFSQFLKELLPKRHTLIKNRLKLAPKIRSQSLRLPYLLWAKELEGSQLKSYFLKAASKEGLGRPTI